MTTLSSSSNPHLRDYFDVIIRRRWPVSASFLIIVLLVGTYLVVATRHYSASATIMIEQSSARSMSIKEALTFDSSNAEFYQTQYKIIGSRTLAETVISKLRLYERQEFVAPEDRKAPGGNPLSEEALIEKAMGAFSLKLEIIPVRQSRLVTITFSSVDPKLAATVANVVAQSYITYTIEHRLKLTQTAVNFLSSRIEEQRHKLEASQLALQKYMEEKKLASVMSDQYSDITAQKIAELNSQLVQATASRKEAQLRHQQAKQLLKETNKLSGIPDILASPVIQSVRQRQLELSKELAELSQRYGPNHPKITGLRAEISAVNADMQSETTKIISSIGNQFEVAWAKEMALEEALEKQKAEAMSVSKQAIGFSVLKREVDTNQQLYDLLLAKTKEARVSEEIDVGNVSIVDPAKVPRTPSSPKVKMIAALGVILGMLLSLGLGFFMEYLDNTIKFPEEIEPLLGVPHLVHIPYSGLQVSRAVDGGSKRKSVYENISGHTPIGEAFRALRTAITLSRAEAPPRTITITSAMASEGKSLIASHLAGIFAAAGEHVLLIDADLRKPNQHKLWEISREFGLSSILTGGSELEKVLHKNVVPNLDIIASGPLPPNPSDLLQAPLMHQLLELLTKHYTRIIIDSPPILPVADPIILGNMTEGIVLVTSAGKTPAHALKQAVDRLGNAKDKLLGAVLNRTVTSRTDYYYKGYKYKYYYAYNYGNASGEKGHVSHKSVSKNNRS